MKDVKDNLRGHGAPIRLPPGPSLAWYMSVFLVVPVTAALAAGGKSIFDDDWTPPPRTEPAAPAPANHSTPAVPAPAPPAGSPKVAGPGERPVTPAISPVAPGGRRPLPAATEQAKSRKLMGEAFSRELADSSPTARRALARKLLEESAKIADTPSDQFVVLGGAIESAVEAADLPLALEAADRMGDAYDLDALAVKASAALKMPAKSYTAYPENLPAGLHLLDSLGSAEDFASASRLVTVLEQVPVADPLLRASLAKRAKEIDELRAARENLAAALQTLKTSPEDPAANLAVGRYLAFLRGEWEQGLPLLAKGNDSKLAALAKAALADPADAANRARLAEGWWELADASTGRAKTLLLQRAADDYRLALPGLTGLGRVLAEKRTAEADAAVAVAGGATTSRPAGVVHLLPLIDAKDLAISGWSRKGLAVVSDAGEFTSMTLGYLPGDEYDYTAEFSRLTGEGDIALGFPVGGRACNFVVGGDHNRRAWLGRIGGKWNEGNPTLADGNVSNNERHRVEVKVRRDGVEGYLDGKRLCYWRTNGDDMMSHKRYMPRCPALLLIGGYRSEFAFYTIDVATRHGTGALAHERDADGRLYSPLVSRPAADGAIPLSARDATVHGRKLIYDGDRTSAVGQDCLQDWTAADDYATWFIDAIRPGNYSAQVTYACDGRKSGSEVEIGLDTPTGAAPANMALTLHIQDTGGWTQFRTESAGTLHLSGGRQTLSVRAKSMPHGAVMNLRQVVLTPVR